MEEEIKQDQEQEEKETLTKGLDAHKDLAQSLSWVSLYQFKSSAPFHWITVEDKIRNNLLAHELCWLGRSEKCCSLFLYYSFSVCVLI